MAIICLVTPGHLGSNPRIVKEADALASQGHQVHVVYGQTHPRDLERDASILAAVRWQVHPVDGMGGTLLHRLRRLRQLAAAAAFQHRPRSLRLAIAAQHQLASCLRRTVASIPADLYIAHYVAALPAVAAAARSHSGLYAFDAEDFHLGDTPEDSTYDRQRLIIRTIETALLPGCAYVSASSPGIADAYRSTYEIDRPTVIRNVFPLSHAPDSPSSRGSALPGPSLYWFSQTIGPDRGLECAVQALAIAKTQPHLYLRGFINPDYRQKLESLARSAGVGDRLHLKPPALPHQMERLAAEHDLGLVAETGLTPNRRIALTNKLFTYVLAGIPALISDIPAHRDYAKQMGRSVRLFKADDPYSLADGIDSLLLRDSRLRAELRFDTFRHGQEKLNWDCEKHVFLGQVFHALDTH